MILLLAELALTACLLVASMAQTTPRQRYDDEPYGRCGTGI